MSTDSKNEYTEKLKELGKTPVQKSTEELDKEFSEAIIKDFRQLYKEAQDLKKLMGLKDGEPFTADAINRKTRYPLSHITRRLELLIGYGFVKRCPPPNANKLVLVTDKFGLRVFYKANENSLRRQAEAQRILYEAAGDDNNYIQQEDSKLTVIKKEATNDSE